MVLALAKSLLVKSRENPHLVFPGLLSLMNGYLHRIKFFLTGRRIKVGKYFRVHGKLLVRGPGRIEIGYNFLVHSDIFGTTSLHTESKEAVIKIGNDVGMNGTIVRCVNQVRISDQCLFANAYLSDFKGHNLSVCSRMLLSKRLPNKEIKIGKNVWISSYVVVGMGVEIGEGSVIGTLSFVDKDVAPYSFCAGSPAKTICPLE